MISGISAWFVERGQVIHLATPFLSMLGIDQIIQPFEAERLGAMNHDPMDPTGANSWDRYSSQSYGSVYSRTATTLHDLEEQLGKDVLERAFKQYYATWKYRHPGIGDLQATLAEVSGKPDVVARAFAQQVYSTGPLDDRIDNLSSEEIVPEQGTSNVDGKWVEVTQHRRINSLKKSAKIGTEKSKCQRRNWSVPLSDNRRFAT